MDYIFVPFDYQITFLRNIKNNLSFPFWQVDEPEKVILDYREKIEFYRTKMQELVSNCNL